MNEVKGDNKHYFTDFTYGGFDAGRTWAVPKEDVDSALYLDANFEKAYKIDDISSVFHYELIVENGGPNSYMSGERKGEILCSDGMLHEGEITSLPLAFSISPASEDHYLDVDFAKKVPDLDCEFCDDLGCDELGVGSLRSDMRYPGTSNEEVGISESSVVAPRFFNDQFKTMDTDELGAGNLRSDFHSPGTSNEEVGISESPILVPQCFNGQLKNTNTDDMHGESTGKCRYERLVEENMSPNISLTCDIQDVRESNDDRNTLERGSIFSHDGKETDLSLPSVEAPCTSICGQDEYGTLSQCSEAQDFSVNDPSTDSCAETKIVRVRQRRICRPPQRYLDGSQWLKSRLQNSKNHPISLLKDKELEVKSKKKHRRKALEIKASRPWTNNLELGSDEEYEPVVSCFNTKKLKKRIDRRKVSQPWTLDEVVSLVDGMSQYGIGQWTAVKRAFFSSSRRTATDIRDKWRNLVKTNCRSSRGRKDVQHMRSGSQPLPKPVIERVRELADAPILVSTSKRGPKLSRSSDYELSTSLAE